VRFICGDFVSVRFVPGVLPTLFAPRSIWFSACLRGKIFGGSRNHTYYKQFPEGGEHLRVTVLDVAQAAQVSATTVSLSFQEESRVSPATRNRVLATAQQLGYIPNQFARRLRSGKSRLIGLLVAEMHSPRIAQVIADVERLGIEQGYNVLVFNTFRDIEIEKRVVQSASELSVEGIIIMACEEKNERLDQMCAAHFPLVYLNSLPPQTQCPHIIYDMEKVASIGMKYLLRLGHRKILLLNSEKKFENFSSFSRLEKTFRATLKKRGIACNPDFIRYCGTTIEAGRNAIAEALQEGLDFSAVFAVCDATALGAIESLEASGHQVPRDVSVLGIDNIEIAALSRINLSTIQIDSTKRGLGELAMHLLFQTIEKGEYTPEQKIVLQPRLIERQSCRQYHL
jgi:LacI family transcriptional regulator